MQEEIDKYKSTNSQTRRMYQKGYKYTEDLKFSINVYDF